MIYLILAPLAVVLAWVTRNLIRNNRVFKFRAYVNELTYQYSMRSYTDGWKKFYGRLPNYHEMVASSKPLKLETYFTDEEIAELLGVQRDNP